jgi:hypothetical protein
MTSNSPTMRILAALLPLAALSLPAAPSPAAPSRPAAAAPRCGWIQNPTPGNWWLDDRDGEWLIGMQGGYQAPGLDSVPDLTERHWVVTNGASYGYGCACVSGTFDPRKKRVTRIGQVRQKPIAACRADRKLKRPD